MAHNPEVAGSNPAPATMKTRLIDGFFVYRHLGCNFIQLLGCYFDSGKTDSYRNRSFWILRQVHCPAAFG